MSRRTVRMLWYAFLLSLTLPPLLPWGSAQGQSLLSRTPNLSGGWVGERGAIMTTFNHRFWFVETPEERKIMNSPTFMVGLPLPGQLMAGAVYASNSRVAAGRFNEWEMQLRWQPRVVPGPFGVGLTGGYNVAAGSVDGELSLSAGFTLPGGFPGDAITLLASGRALTDALGSGESGWFGGGGAILHLGSGFALSGDFGRLRTGAEEVRAVWGAGVQMSIPASPHTLALYATNAQTGTLQGSSAGGRTVWGFEFTVPLTIARYLPGAARSAPSIPDTSEGGLEVLMTDDLRYIPELLQIRAGETVRWRNSSNLIHTVTADPSIVRDPSMVALPTGAAPFDSGEMRSGDTFQHTFTVPGIYIYLCLPHDRMGMLGTIVVLPSPEN